MMEYVVVEEYDPEAIGKRVDEFLNDGWELYGNLVLTAYYARDGKNPREQHRTIYAQALTKQSPDTPDIVRIKTKTKGRRIKVRQ